MKTKGNLSQRHLTFDESSCKMQPPNHSNIDSTNLMHEEEILSIYHEVNNILGGGAGVLWMGYEQNVQFSINLKQR